MALPAGAGGAAGLPQQNPVSNRTSGLGAALPRGTPQAPMREGEQGDPRPLLQTVPGGGLFPQEKGPRGATAKQNRRPKCTDSCHLSRLPAADRVERPQVIFFKEIIFNCGKMHIEYNLPF